MEKIHKGLHTMKQISIAFIGFRATGKSFLGKILAETLNRQFVDMDERLIESFGRPINEWVAIHGWQSFRQAESKLLEALSTERNIVLATGGGIILSSQNRETLRTHFLVVWLQASPETIHARLTRDPKSPSHRPALTTLSLKEEIRELLAERSPLYEETAHLIITTDNAHPAELVSGIRGFLEDRNPV
jgi:shikimate kinase